MPSEIICPHCGIHLPIDQQEPSDQGQGPVESRTVEIILPATVSTEGMPAFEGFQDFDFKVQESIIDSRSDLDVIRFGDSEMDSSGLADAKDLTNLGGNSRQDVFLPKLNGSGSHSSSGSSEKLAVLSQLDLSTPSPGPSAQEAAKQTSEATDDDEDEDDRPSAWPIALLISYSSVITLICLWMWWNGRPTTTGADWDDFWYVEEGPDPGIRANQSIQFEPLPEIPDELRTPLSGSLEVGRLEITPQAVSTGSVLLNRVRVDGQAESRGGESKVLKLTIRLRNTSSDLIFAPLDEAFVRDPDRKPPDSFLEDAQGRRIYTYKLPVTSEWSIQGQEFQELRPGESMDGVIVSSAIVPQDLEGPLTWRIRLRTGPDQTEFVGVQFQVEDILEEGEA